MNRKEKIEVISQYIKRKRQITARQLEAIQMIVNDNEDVVRKLVENPHIVGGWSEQAARIALRANFCCEYCGKNMIKTVDNYKDFHREHIDPSGGDDDDNLALACKQCNFYKRGTTIERMQKYLKQE